MDYQFREIRKGECAKVLSFAASQGSSVQANQLHHHLSLIAMSQGEMVAAALCVEYEPEHYIIELVHQDDPTEDLVTELTDRCFRKVQSQGITSARLHSPAKDATQTIWKNANWLDRIQETPPPADDRAARDSDDDASSQAA